MAEQMLLVFISLLFSSKPDGFCGLLPFLYYFIVVLQHLESTFHIYINFQQEDLNV